MEQPLRSQFSDPTDRIRLVMLTNEREPNAEPGLREALAHMQSTGEIAAWSAIAPALVGASWSTQFNREVERIRANVVLALSPGSGHFGLPRLLEDRDDVVVLYWEGDAYGRAKPISAEMRRWAQRSDILFSVAGPPQAESLLSIGTKRIQLILNTYCQVTFARYAEEDPLLENPDLDVVVVGSRVTRLRFFSALPGGAKRVRLVRGLRTLNLRVRIFGGGWRGSSCEGAIPYSRQAEVMRRARITANWDHYDQFEGFSSDRLPISLLAGRIHVTSRHPGVDAWSSAPGLIQVDSVQQALEQVDRLSKEPEDLLLEEGKKAWLWARGRVSDREAARFMLRFVDDRIAPPPTDPWDSLPSWCAV